MKAPGKNVRTMVKGLVRINCYGTLYLWYYANDWEKKGRKNSLKHKVKVENSAGAIKYTDKEKMKFMSFT